MTNSARVLEQTADALEAQAEVLITQAGYLRAEAHRENSVRQSSAVEEDSKTVTLQRACELTALGETFLREEIKAGRLAAVKFGRQALRIRLSSLREWVRTSEKRVR